MMEEAACIVTMREKLPTMFRAVGDLLGDRPLLALIEAHCGNRLYIPASVGETDHLAVMLGIEPARRLVAAYGRDTLDIPLCKAWRAHILQSDGHSHAVIARRLGMHRISVMRLLSGTAPAGEEAGAQLRFRFG